MVVRGLRGPARRSCNVHRGPNARRGAAARWLRRRDLEKGKTHEKVNAMKKTILMMINGEMMDGFLMIIIRFVLPDEDRELKKLSLLYLEIVDKTDAAGKMLPEFILVWCARTPARRPAHHPGTAQHTGRCVHTSGVAARKLQGTTAGPTRGARAACTPVAVGTCGSHGPRCARFRFRFRSTATRF